MREETILYADLVLDAIPDEDLLWYVDHVIRAEQEFYSVVKGADSSSADAPVPPPFTFFFCPLCPNSVEVASKHIDEFFAIACRAPSHRMVPMKRQGE